MLELLLIGWNKGELPYMFLFLCLLLAAPLLLVGLDLSAGIRKARERGDLITSKGWRRTVQKVGRYYNALFAMLVVDTLQMGAVHYFNAFHGYEVWRFPFFTLFGVAVVARIEIKSIYETAEEKERRAATDLAKGLAKIARERSGSVMKLLIDELSKMDNKRDGGDVSV